MSMRGPVASGGLQRFDGGALCGQVVSRRQVGDRRTLQRKMTQAVTAVTLSLYQLKFALEYTEAKVVCIAYTVGRLE